MKNIYASILFISFVFNCLGQQLAIDNQFIINKTSLSPALAGKDGNFEIFATDRKQWSDFKDSPHLQIIRLSGRVHQNGGIGISFINEKEGIFRNTSMSVNYAYHLEINADQNLSFSLGGSYKAFTINYSGYQIDKTNDPVLISANEKDMMMFNIFTGLSYSYKNTHLSLSAFNLVPNVNSTESGLSILSSRKYYTLNAFTTINLTNSLDLRPYVIVLKESNMPLVYGISLPVHFNNSMWLGVSYKDNRNIGFCGGLVLLKKLVINYCYEINNAYKSSVSLNTHELSIGWLLSKGKANNYSSSIFTTKVQPYMNWMDKK